MAPRVLLICDQGQSGSSAAAKLALTSTGMFTASDIDILQNIDQISNEDLDPYDVVLVWSYYSFPEPSRLGNILRDFVDAGGGVVLAMNVFNSYYEISGRILDPYYSPFLPTFGKSVSGEIDFSQLPRPEHPVFADISSNLKYWTNYKYSNPELNTGGIILAEDTWGNKVVAVNQDENIIGITIYPGMLSDATTNRETRRLFANSLYYVWKDSWLNIGVSEGIISASDSMVIDIFILYIFLFKLQFNYRTCNKSKFILKG